MPITRRHFLASSGLSLAAPMPLEAHPAPSAPHRISQVELEATAHRHGLWHRRQPGGQIADLGGYDLSELRFGRWELRHANFTGANMQSIKAIETRFFRSHMTGCDLSGAMLLDCDLRCVDLTRARLTSAQILDSQFDWPNSFGEGRHWYCGEGLSGAKLNQADLSGSRINVTIDGVDFTAADLRQADLRGVFGAAHFEDADLRQANFGHAHLAESVFEGAVFAKTNVRDANLFGCKLTAAQRDGLQNAASARPREDH
ncbi:pentapeptide repeat-containing protein [Ferrovibrio sp.]|uniref:pentapeptide repeat-containing protein n=1 Tax=Ferrovibrio sp. TaxID=1917215 RepID=UPI000CB4506E|nr:pentapeptide repeat-containing protein [Ferrovibrio sp.]PJI42208.1 MAG: hypothetical protein CTR53_07160 [Ferrovibrio sp.]